MKDTFNKLKYLIFGFFVFFLYLKVLPLLLSVFLSKYLKNASNLTSNILLSIAEIIVFLVLFYIFRKVLIGDFKKYKKDYKKDLDVGFKYYCIGLIVMILSNLLLTFIFGGIAANESVNREYMTKYPLYSVIAMVMIGPLVEEIVFRLGFRKAFSKELTYCLFSALLFGGLHVYTAYEGMKIAEMLKNWSQVFYIIPYGSLGYAFAKTYYKTDNIFTSMTIHVLHNAFTVFIVFCSL